MKFSADNRICVLMLTLSLLVSRVSAQQIPDTGFEFKIAHPHFEKGKGPVIGIDEAHHNFHTLQGRFAAFAKLLQSDGYNVERFNTKFTAKKLQNIQVLVISNALNKRNADNDWSLPSPSAFLPEEIVAVNQWVAEGGRLLEYGKGKIVVSAEAAMFSAQYTLSAWKISKKMSEVLNRIKIIIAEKLAIDEAFILPEASFKEDFGADSLDVVELLVEFERVFELIIPDEQLDKITTVGSAVSFIESALKEKIKPFHKTS